MPDYFHIRILKPCASNHLLSWKRFSSMLFVAAGQANVMDYFSERSNPFYERTCNNEILKMQKLGVADVQLQNMQVGAFGSEHGQINYIDTKAKCRHPKKIDL